MLADCHMHMILDGQYWKAAIARHARQPDEEFIRAALENYRQLGFGYLRDGGDRWGAGLRARELAPEYGIVYRTPLGPLCQKGHYGSFIGDTYETLEDYARLVKKRREQGADFIKIMISGLMDFDHCGRLTEEGLDPDRIRELIHIAHSEGFSVMAHANGARTVEAAALAGVDSVEHGAYQDEASLKAMAEMGCVWVPTLSTVGNLRGKGRFREEAVEAILASALKNVTRFHSLGGLLAPGSDAGAWAVPHGSKTEFELLEQALGTEADLALAQGTRVIRERF